MKNRKFKNAVIAEVELLNGNNTEVVVLFDSLDVNFEYISMGISKALQRSGSVRKFKNTVCNLHNGEIKKFAEYSEQDLSV